MLENVRNVEEHPQNFKSDAFEIEILMHVHEPEWLVH